MSESARPTIPPEWIPGSPEARLMIQRQCSDAPEAQLKAIASIAHSDLHDLKSMFVEHFPEYKGFPEHLLDDKHKLAHCLINHVLNGTIKGW